LFFLPGAWYHVPGTWYLNNILFSHSEHLSGVSERLFLFGEDCSGSALTGGGEEIDMVKFKLQDGEAAGEIIERPSTVILSKGGEADVVEPAGKRPRLLQESLPRDRAASSREVVAPEKSVSSAQGPCKGWPFFLFRPSPGVQMFNLSPIANMKRATSQLTKKVGSEIRKIQIVPSDLGIVPHSPFVCGSCAGGIYATYADIYHYMVGPGGCHGVDGVGGAYTPASWGSTN
jgi:hypothetical protein